MEFSNAQDLALLLFRASLGLMMAAHGYAKFFSGGKLAGTASWFDSMGMRPGKVHALLAASTEVGAGLLFAAGLLTPLAAAALVGLMVVAGWTTHRGKGFFILNEGWEYVYIIAVAAVAIATIGPGAYSLDNAFGIDDLFGDWTRLAISAGLGAASGVGLMAAFYRPPAEANG